MLRKWAVTKSLLLHLSTWVPISWLKLDQLLECCVAVTISRATTTPWRSQLAAHNRLCAPHCNDSPLLLKYCFNDLMLLIKHLMKFMVCGGETRAAGFFSNLTRSFFLDAKNSCCALFIEVKLGQTNVFIHIWQVEVCYVLHNLNGKIMENIFHQREKNVDLKLVQLSNAERKKFQQTSQLFF